MINMSVYLTGVGLLMIPVTVVATYYFRRVMRQIFRRIRDSVSALNQYMQEDLIGIEVVQISGREAMNSAHYGELNQANRNHEFHAINYEVMFETFNMSLASVATVCILWFGGGQVVQESISLGVLILFTQLINMLVMPVESVGRFFNTLFRSMASGERIFQALDWDERLHEPTDPVRLTRAHARRGGIPQIHTSPTPVASPSCMACRSRSRRAKNSPSSAPPARARARSFACSRASTTSTTA